MIFALRKTPTLAQDIMIAAVFILACWAAPTNASASPSSQLEGSNDVIVRDAFEKWTAGTGNVFDLLSPNIQWTVHGSGPVADTYIGIEDFLQRGAAPLVSRLTTALKPEVHNVWEVEDRVIIRFDAEATTTSGAPYRNQFVWIFRMEDGSVVETEAFLDLVAYQGVIDNNEPRQQ